MDGDYEDEEGDDDDDAYSHRLPYSCASQLALVGDDDYDLNDEDEEDYDDDDDDLNDEDEEDYDYDDDYDPPPPAQLRILVSSGWCPANLLSQKPSWWIALNNNKKDRIQPSTLSLSHRDLVFNSKNV